MLGWSLARAQTVYLSPGYARRGRFGFIINPKRFAVHDGSSSFIGWQPGTTSA